MRALLALMAAAVVTACATEPPAQRALGPAPTTVMGAGQSVDEGKAIAESLGFHGPVRRFSEPPGER